jgi:hypothetical protein
VTIEGLAVNRQDGDNCPRPTPRCSRYAAIHFVTKGVKDEFGDI